MKHICRTLALAAFTVCVVAGQPVRPDLTAVANELGALCSQANAAGQAEEGILQDHKSAAVTRALSSESDFWQFVADPSTPYRDRMAAARQGGGLIGLERLPELWEAQADIDRSAVPRIISPCYYLMSSNMTPLNWVTRHNQPSVPAVQPQSNLFKGRRFPQMEYPITQADIEKAPWFWQMEIALQVLMNAVGMHYAQPDLYPKMADVAWNWQTSDWWEASVRVGALCRGPRNAEWLKNVIRLTLEHNPAQISSGAGVNTIEAGPTGIPNLYVFGGDTYHFEELVHAAQVIILQRTNNPRVAEGAAFQIAQLATHKYTPLGPNCPLKPLQTATAALTIAQWALNQNLDPLYRYTYAGATCQFVNDPPYHYDQNASLDIGKVTIALGAFDTWFSEHRPQLEKAAAAEHAHFNALASELHETIK